MIEHILVDYKMIVWCYRLLLAREPESNHAVLDYVRQQLSLDELRRIFCTSNEFINGSRCAMLRDKTHYISEYAVSQQTDLVLNEEAVRYAQLIILNTEVCSADDKAKYLNSGHVLYLLKNLIQSDVYPASPIAKLLTNTSASRLKTIDIQKLPPDCFKDNVASSLFGQISYPEFLESQLSNISISRGLFSSHELDMHCNITLHSIPLLDIQLVGSCHINIGSNCKGKWVFYLEDSTHVNIGNDTQTYLVNAHLQVGATLSIGHDCYFEGVTHFRMGDSHAVFNMQTLDVLNYKQHPYIHIHDHVFVRESVNFLADCTVQSGCTIEQRSLLKGLYTHNSLIVGCPARAVQNDVLWSKSNIPQHLEQLAHYVEH